MNKATVSKLPTQQEVEQAKETSRILSKFSNQQLRVKITGENSVSEDIILPGYAIELLLDILTQISKGNAVSILPVHAEITTQEAANLLNVSRPYLIELLESKMIPYKKVGTHRRILAKDIFAYKARDEEERLKVLEELTSEGQKLKLGYR